MTLANSLLPITSAYSGKSCTSCCESPRNILKCASCSLVGYCSRTCQLADWPKHKQECKLLKLFKATYSSIPCNDSERLAKARGFLESLPMFLSRTDPDLDLLTLSQLQGFNETRFKNFVLYGRACSICLLNEYSVESHGKVDWKCCSSCGFGWCCSTDHWEEYKGQHSPEICNLYQSAGKMNLFHHNHVKGNDAIFLKVPEKVLKIPLANFPESWDGYFRTRFVGSYPENLPFLPPEFFPASTQLLSQPVTCLAAMYKLGISHFAKKRYLTIHVVGASDYEVPATCVWEEILHCLPNLRTLTIQFVGPECCKIFKSPTDECPTFPVPSCCPKCTSQGRQRLTGFFGYTYHDYASKYLSNSKHSKPDLIVAFNTRMFEAETESWKTSLEVVLEMNVPTYFTSYSLEEGVQDFELLQGMNANILQEGPSRNPFGEDMMQIESLSEHRIDRFFATNMYGVLFQGLKKI